MEVMEAPMVNHTILDMTPNHFHISWKPVQEVIQELLQTMGCPQVLVELRLWILAWKVPISYARSCMLTWLLMVPIASMMPWVLGLIVDLYLLQVRTTNVTSSHMVFWVGKCRHEVWSVDAWLPLPTLATDMLKRWALIPVVGLNCCCFCWFYIFKLMYLVGRCALQHV